MCVCVWCFFFPLFFLGVNFFVEAMTRNSTSVDVWESRVNETKNKNGTPNKLLFVNPLSKENYGVWGHGDTRDLCLAQEEVYAKLLLLCTSLPLCNKSCKETMNNRVDCLLGCSLSCTTSFIVYFYFPLIFSSQLGCVFSSDPKWCKFLHSFGKTGKKP